jgi:hypothetical protein
LQSLTDRPRAAEANVGQPLRPADALRPPKAGGDSRPDPERLRQQLLGGDRQEWLTPEAVPALLQLLQAENRPVRLVLVELLGQIEDRRATKALAVRAMVDLAPEDDGCRKKVRPTGNLCMWQQETPPDCMWQQETPPDCGFPT